MTPPPVDPDAIPLPESIGESSAFAVSALDLLNAYAPIFVTAFLVTVLLTPVARRIALAAGVIDRPDEDRKLHRFPVAYLGGVSVFAGLVAAVAVSYLLVDPYSEQFSQMPLAIVVGMVAIMVTGLADDVWGWDPRLKIAGQLVAAAALALNDIGVRVANGMLAPLVGPEAEVLFAIGSFEVLNAHLFYWSGTALIAFFVLGGCNAANLLDGLDGLLSGVVGIVAVGLLAICVMMAVDLPLQELPEGAESLAGARIVLCLALLGAVLGFLPHNFNPATIFLGDCGSLLIGFVCVTIILMMGELGQTHLVFAGLIIFAVPIMDTTLAIIRRWLAGTSMSSGDHQHMHHQLKRSLGGVKRAVFALYGIATLFAIVGVTLAWLVTRTDLRVRVIYAIALVLFAFTGVIAVKSARRQQLLAQERVADAARRPRLAQGSEPESEPEPEPPKKAVNQ